MEGLFAYLMVQGGILTPRDRGEVVNYLTLFGAKEIFPHTEYGKTGRPEGTLIVWCINEDTPLPMEEILEIIGRNGHFEQKWRCHECGVVRTRIIHPNNRRRNREFICECPIEVEVAA